jgi:hypothetical protein
MRGAVNLEAYQRAVDAARHGPAVIAPQIVRLEIFDPRARGDLDLIYSHLIAFALGAGLAFLAAAVLS